MTTRIAIHGAAGRMGLSIVRLSAGENVDIVGAIESSQSKHLGRDIGELAGIGNMGVEVSADVSAGLLGADVVIDFSTPKALLQLIPLAMRANVAIVSGTTGLTAEHRQALQNAANKIAILSSPNMSIGVQVLAHLVTKAIQMLGTGFDIEIVETHHKAKIDAPSGTALRLLEAAKLGRDNLSSTHGRSGNVGARSPNEVAVLALRGGDVIGDHTVHLLGLGERIELTHRATNRDLFARGAIVAAKALRGKPAGIYAMADVLGF